MGEGSSRVGEFACESGSLLICDTAPSPELPEAAADGSQCLHLRMRPGRYRVEYVHGEEGPDAIPAKVLILHESMTAATGDYALRRLLSVEGGRIAVIDRERAADRQICEDFLYQSADTILRDCGIVISTWGDGRYPILLGSGDGPRLGSLHRARRGRWRARPDVPRGGPFAWIRRILRRS